MGSAGAEPTASGAGNTTAFEATVYTSRQGTDWSDQAGDSWVPLSPWALQAGETDFSGAGQGK
jgi:hypothetical protein